MPAKAQYIWRAHKSLQTVYVSSGTSWLNSQLLIPGVQTATRLPYVDLLYVHWPSCSTGDGCTDTGISTDPACQWGGAAYDERNCRLQTWRAMVQIWRAGGARAIGVSNYNVTHLEEIEAAGLPLPAANQIPFSIYHSAMQAATIAHCAAKGILVNGYR